MQATTTHLSFKDIFGLNFVSISFNKFAQIIADLVLTEKKITVFPVSVDVLIKSRNDIDFFLILKRASFVTPDGMPIVWASRILGKKLKAKISGSDLFPALCKNAAEKNYRIFFLGAKPRIAQRASEILKRQYPRLNVVGVYSPPFGFEKLERENQNIIKMINEKRPDILFIGLGAPKQEKWIWRFKNELNVPVSVTVGASFDFIAGNIKRAPKWMQKIGLEWFYRLCQEPHRLWKRYLVGNIIFVWLVLKESIK